MTDVEFYRTKKLMPQLHRLAEEYPMHTLDNVIRQLDQRIEHYKASKAKK